MKKLVTDVFVRRLAQVFLLAIGAGIVVVCLVFMGLTIDHSSSGFVSSDRWKYLFMQAISFPFDSAFGTFVTGLSAVIPTVLSSVCFVNVTADGAPPKAGSVLNGVGHAFILLLAAGILFSVVSIFLISTGDWSGVFPAEAQDASLKQMRALFGGLMAIQGSYLAMLVKDKS
ncbi:hypothetical protein [Rhizobium sp. SGZ-381]|uniref:hypothetical protein n=1 Tax=Rhizobium sp. SGZ-381 TaxID=3342800 RepID=UPI00366E51F8